MKKKITTIKLTKLGYSFLGLIILFYFFSLISQIGLLYFIIGIVLGCYVINFIGALRSINRLEVNLPELIKTVESNRIITPITLNNRSLFQIGLITISSEFGSLVKIKSLPGGKKVHISPDIIFDVRGVYKLSHLKISSIFPFGFIMVSKTLSLKGEIVVYPAVYNCPAPAAAGVGPVVGGKFSGLHKSVYGNDFAGVRPFQFGDPVKYIHWKSSSKGQGFMVKQFNEELSGHVSFIIDNSAFRVSDKEITLDCAIRAAGSMIFSSLDIGHHTELIDLSDLNVLHIPPFSDGDIVLETLAGIRHDDRVLNKKNIDIALSHLSSKAAVCFILTKLNNDVLQSIAKLVAENRTVSVYLPSVKILNKSINRKNTLIIKLNDNQIHYYTENTIL